MASTASRASTRAEPRCLRADLASAPVDSLGEGRPAWPARSKTRPVAIRSLQLAELGRDLLPRAVVRPAARSSDFGRRDAAAPQPLARCTSSCSRPRASPAGRQSWLRESRPRRAQREALGVGETSSSRARRSRLVACLALARSPWLARSELPPAHLPTRVRLVTYFRPRQRQDPTTGAQRWSTGRFEASGCCRPWPLPRRGAVGVGGRSRALLGLLLIAGGGHPEPVTVTGLRRPVRG